MKKNEITVKQILEEISRLNQRGLSFNAEIEELRTQGAVLSRVFDSLVASPGNDKGSSPSRKELLIGRAIIGKKMDEVLRRWVDVTERVRSLIILIEGISEKSSFH